MEKMTNVKALNYVLANTDLPTEVREKVENIRNQFEKKNGGEKKPTANQVANDNLRSTILAEMEPNVFYTITDMMKKLPCCAELSNQKISALVRTLVTNGEIEKLVEKRISYFRKIG